MENPQLKLACLATVLVTVNLLVSCAPKGSPLKSGDAGGSAPSGFSGSTAQGTSDSGGGTGVAGKIFESYMVKPTELLAFKQYLSPILSNIKAEKETGQPQFAAFFGIKTWYIAPVDLAKISKDVLGVSFMKSATQQIARQTLKEVWIDKRVFDQMSQQSQGELLLHEMVMNLYFFKFMRMKEFCSAGMVADETQAGGCGPSIDAIDKAMPPEKSHPLTDEDNENIRFVTGWILQNATKPVPYKTLESVLISKGFDKRFFNSNPAQTADQAETLDISKVELFKAINGATLSGNMPSVCNGQTLQTSKDCKVEINETTVLYRQNPLPAYKLQLAIEGQTPIIFNMPVGDTATLNRSLNADGKVLYTFAAAEMKEKFAVGDRTYFSLFIFGKNSSDSASPLLLQSIILKPSVIVSIDKSRDPVCLIRSPKAQKLSDDNLIIRQQGAQPTAVESLLATSDPVAFCNADNVAE